MKGSWSKWSKLPVWRSWSGINLMRREWSLCSALASCFPTIREFYIFPRLPVSLDHLLRKAVALWHDEDRDQHTVPAFGTQRGGIRTEARVWLDRRNWTTT